MKQEKYLKKKNLLIICLQGMSEVIEERLQTGIQVVVKQFQNYLIMFLIMIQIINRMNLIIYLKN